MMSSISAYLFAAKAHTHDAQKIILGNEAADLDSMVSAICYGYLQYLLNSAPCAPLVLPLTPIFRADFKLRTEAVYVFHEAGIPLQNIVFIDEIDFDALMSAGAELVLVDHNKLCPTLGQYEGNVSGILDHHHDEGMHDNAAPRIIEMVGSCSTLVAMEFEKAGVIITEDVATLLGGAILLDTINLGPSAGRVTATDKRVAETLLPLCSLSQQEYFDNIQREKFNVSGLCSNDLLRKDYKEFQCETVRCGIASVPLSIGEWQKMEEDLPASFADYVVQHQLEILLAMSAYRNPDFSRDLVLYCLTRESHDALLTYLQNNALDLTEIIIPGRPQIGDGGVISFHHQGNCTISRKKLQPLLIDFLKYK